MNAPLCSFTSAPDSVDDMHAGDARQDALNDGLPADDDPVHHDVLDAIDDQGIVDSWVGLGGMCPVAHLDVPVAVADD